MISVRDGVGLLVSDVVGGGGVLLVSSEELVGGGGSVDVDVTITTDSEEL